MSTSPSEEATQEQNQTEPVLIDSELIPFSLPETQRPYEVSAEFVVDIWDSQATSIDASSSSGIELQPQLGNSPYLGLDESQAALPGSIDLLEFGQVEEFERCSSMEFVLPPVVLYQDLAQKYYHILEMCKLWLYRSSLSPRADLQ